MRVSLATVPKVAGTPLFPEDSEIPAPEPKIVIQKAGIEEAIVAAFSALGYALSARLILLLAMAGAFCLGVMAINDPTSLRLEILVAYSFLTVIPIALLEAFGKRPMGG